MAEAGPQAAGEGLIQDGQQGRTGCGVQAGEGADVRVAGALNLLRVTQTPMAEADLIVGRAFAGLASLSIVPPPRPSG